MFQSFPFFYADMIARLIPGALALVLLLLTRLQVPNANEVGALLGENASVVIVPLLYAGTAYLIGTLLEAGLSNWLEKWYVCAFKRAVRNYPWTLDKERFRQKSGLKKRSYTTLSRASFGQLSVSPSEQERYAMSHIIRYHAEAKMCLGVSVFLAIFLLLSLGDCLFKIDLVRDIGFWLLLLVVALGGSLYAVYDRLHGRARFIIRTIERLAELGGDQTFSLLRDELYSRPSHSRNENTSSCEE